MANTITAETVVNPYGANDIASYIVIEDKKDLIISKCMPYVTDYTFQFWIKSSADKTVIFNCDSTVKKIFANKSWQYFTVTFKVSAISNIKLSLPKGKYWIYNTKLEIGEHDTDWSPHPEDDNLEIERLESEMDKQKEDILVATKNEITEAIDIVNKQDLYTERGLTRTEFVSEVYGKINSLDVDTEAVRDGNGKWHVAIYDKDDFIKLTKMPQDTEDWSTNQYSIADAENDDTGIVYDDGEPWGANDYIYVNIPSTVTPSSGNDDDEDDEDEPSPAQSVETELDDRDRIDMLLFSGENANVKAISETMVEDNPILLRLDGNGKVIYYYTFARFTEDTQALLKCPFRDSSFYVNGQQIISKFMIGTQNVQVNFTKGWNLIQIISNEGNFTIDPAISTLENCELINCLISIPTSYDVRMSSRTSRIYTTLDKIVSEVWQYDTEQYVDSKGNIKTRKIPYGSRIKMTLDMIKLLVRGKDGDFSSFEVTPKMIEAITQKFTVTDPKTGTKTVIAGGKILTDSIDADMLNTDAIQSRNFNGGHMQDYRIKNKTTGVERQYSEMVLNDLFDGNGDIVFNTQGSYLDLKTGNFLSPSMIILNDYTQADDNIHVQNKAYFKGDVHSDNAYINGTVVSADGQIGPWHITGDSIYKGNNTLGLKGVENAYLGEDGLSLSDVFVYDSENQTLRMKVNMMDLSGSDILDFTSKASDGNNTYYVNALADLDALTSSWNNELAKHVDELCYVISTGKLYRFVKKKNAQNAEVIYSIKFHASTNFRASDYMSIYYKYGKTVFKVVSSLSDINSGNFSLNYLADRTIKIPSDNFYIFLHIGEASSGLVDYYGFTISSVTASYGASSELTYALNANLPDYPLDRSLAVGVFPETAHPYTQTLTNKLWQVRVAPNSNYQNYQWTEIVNEELAEGARNALYALTFLHYDASNGLLLHNGLHALDKDSTLTTSDLNQLVGGNVRLTSSGMDVYIGNTKLATYGTETLFYKTGTNTVAARLNANGLEIEEGIIKLGTITGFNDTTSGHKGLFVDSLGNFFLGNTSTYIKWNSSNNKLNINAESVSIGGNSAATDTDARGYASSAENNAKGYADGLASTINSEVSRVSGVADGAASSAIEAAKTATNYLWWNNTHGLVIHGKKGDLNSIDDLNGTTKYVNTRFKQDGMSLYVGNAKIASYGATTNFYKYDGTANPAVAACFGANGLEIKSGTISLGSKTSYNDTQHNGFFVDSNGNMGLGANFTVTNQGVVSIKSGTISLGSKTSYNDTSHNGFYVDSDGNLGLGANCTITKQGTLTASNAKLSSAEISGKVTASEGSIGGSVIGSSALYSTGHTTYNSTANGYYLGSDGYFSIGKNFKVDNQGNMTASNAVINGSLTLGTGVTIPYSSISGTPTIPGMPDLTAYLKKDGTVGSTPGSGTTGFVVSSAGLLQASNAIIYGKIYASSGTIGGITIASNSIYSGSHSTYNNSNQGFYLGSDGKFGIGNSTGYLRWNGSDTLEVSGKVTASSGSIGGITIASNSIYSGSHSLYNSSSQGFYLGSDGKFGIGNSTNYVRWDGSSTLSIKGDITASSGTIGGWNIGTNAIYNNLSSYSGTTVGTYIGTDGIKSYKDSSQFVTIKDGVITAKNAVLYGTIQSIKSDEKLEISEALLRGYRYDSTNGYIQYGLLDLSANYSYSGTRKVVLEASRSDLILKCASKSSIFMETAPLSGNPISLATIQPNSNKSVIFPLVGSSTSVTTGMTVVIDSTGTLSHTSSSRRFKDIDRELNYNDIKAFFNLKTFRAKYKDEHISPSDENYGVYMPMIIAEDVDEICKPAAVHDSKTGLVNDWNPRVIIPVHQEMLRYLKSENDGLKSEIKSLKAEIQQLKERR